MLVLNELTRYYGSFLALDHLSMTIGDGELHGFVGPNGAGKTTTMRILATLLAPSSGTAALDGVEERAEEGLRALGFRLNGAKRALCRDGQQKRVTGLVVNERVAVPACRRRRLRQELYFCRSRGVEEHLRAAGLAEGREQCLRRLLGQVDFWLQAQPDSQEAAEYRRWLLAEMRDKR